MLMDSASVRTFWVVDSTFSLCPHIAGKARQFFGTFLIRVLLSCMKALPNK
jgi:hypothetical protein